MPTVSRRKHKRQNSSDIEDEGPSKQSQRSGQQSRRRASELQPNHSDEGDNDDDEEETIDINDFKDQPLSRQDAQKLQGIGNDWISMEGAVLQNWRIVSDVATAIADIGESDEVEKSLIELDGVMKNLIDIGEEFRFHEQTLNNIAQKIAQGQEVDNALLLYQQGVQKEKSQYEKKTTRQKYGKSEKYTSFKHSIYEVQFPEKPPPPITDFLPKEDGDISDDEDLEVGGSTQVYTCPITLVALDNPVTSGICGHSFSSAAIDQSFRGSQLVKCPASGCNKQFTKNDLKPNKDLAKKVKAWKRRIERAADDIDAEEIID